MAASREVSGEDLAATKPFGMRDKIGYLFGDFGNDFMFIFASSFLMVFYTKVMGIPGAAVGVLFLVARIIDAFADVTVGVVVDKSKRTPKGKYRVWIMRFAAPVTIFSFLMYQTFTINSPEWVKIVYMYVTYIIWGILYSCVNIPYGSMASVISPNPEDRTSLSTFRSVGATFANLFVGVVAPLVIYETDAAGNQIIRGGDGTQIFAIVAGVFAVAAFCCFMICYKLSTERVKRPDNTEGEGKGGISSTFAMIKNAVANRSMVGLIGGAICLLLAMLFMQAMNNYVFADVYRSATLLSTMNLLGGLVTFAVAPFAQPLSRKFGHKTIAVAGGVIAAASMVVLFVMHTTSPVVFIVFEVLAYAGLGAFNLIVFAMVTDVIDDIEVNKGIREDATCYSVYSFARKIGQAFAGGLSGVALSIIGYEAGAAAVQSQAVLDGLYNFATIVPGLFFALMAVFMQFVYPLGKKRVESNVAALKVKHGE